MLRKSTLAVAVALALGSPASHGLTIGDIRSSSLMNHVFEGIIELGDATADEVAGIKARLASAEAFKKAGVEYSGAVKRLRFKPYVQADGRPAIRVTSAEAIRDPFLNFLVEVEWPRGRAVKELTVLLDPPTFTGRRAPAVEAPVAAPPKAGRPPERAAAEPQAAVETGPKTPASQVPAPRPVDGTMYGPVRQGETLWRIAERNRVAGVSAEQTMIAILQANPEAFVGGNINRLRAGARLRVPTGPQAAGLDAAQARDEFLRQMGRPVPQRRPVRAAGEAPPAAPPGDLVRLVTPTPESPAPAKEAVPQPVQPTLAPDLRQDVLLAHEKAESARQTADLLHGRVADLEGQLRDMQRLLVLKDTQLAQLQQRAEEALKAASLAMAKAEAEAAAAAAQRRAEMPAASAVSVEAGRAEPSPAAAAKPAEPIAAPMVPAQAASPSEAATPGEVAKPAAPAAPAEVVRSEPPLAPHEPVDQGKAPQPTGVAGLLSDPANVLGAGIAGLGVLGALLWAMVGRRRSSAREAAIPAETVEPIAAAGATAPGPGPDLAPAGAAAATAEPAAAPVAMAGTVPVAVAAAVAEEVDRVPTEDLAALQVSTTDLFGLKGDTTEVDPAEEADVYVAYGRYEQAEQLLRLALEMEPNRLPLQHKLLEVYAASRDATAFNGLFRELLAAGKDAEDPTAWEQAVRMGRQIDPANPLYGAGEAVDASALDDELGRMGRELDGDLDRLAARDGDFGDLGLKPQTGGVGLDAIDTGSVLNDLSLDLGTEDLGLGKSSHPFNLDVTEELKGSGGSVGGVGEIDAGEALAWGQGKTDASGLVEGEIAPVEVVAEQLNDAARDVPDLGDIDLGPDTVMDLGADTTLAHSDTTLELVDDVETKLDLARAYVELGDQESARLMLEEAMHEGNPAQRAAAEALLKELG